MRVNTRYFLGYLFLIAFVSCKKSNSALETKIETPAAVAKTFYVSANLGSDNNLGTSALTPFKTLNKAAGLTSPGDVVLIMNGTYPSTGGTILNITRSGTADKYITYKPYQDATPIITASGNMWNAIQINGSYIKVEGLEVMGNNANLTLAGAEAAFNDHYNNGGARGTNWELYAPYNTNGITIGGSRAESKKPHHIEVRNCKVHDFPGSGINLNQADYVVIEGNTVYNSAWYTMYGTSGISTLYPINFDSGTGYKIIIRNNIAHHNRTFVKWAGKPGGANYSDGNGIIIDLNQGQEGTDVYTGRTLVENNISYLNGGSGIHTLANRTDIINNTAYKNGQASTNYANIFAGYCTDVKIINNIMYARPGGRINSNTSTTNVTYDYNTYFYTTTTVDGGAALIAVNGAHYKIADPLFVNADNGNFLLQDTSPAVDAGTPTNIYSVKDFNGVARPKGAAVDCGAFEVK